MGFLALIPWAKIGGFILKYWYVALILVFLISWWHRGNVIDDLEAGLKKAKEDNASFEIANKSLNHTLALNEKAIQDCVFLNLENTAEALRQKERADAAEIRAAAADQDAADRTGVINNEAEGLRGRDTGCRSLHSPDFPQWFIDWVRSD